MRITTFNAVKNRNKIPKSPFDIKSSLAKSFTFTTHEVQTLKECFDILSNEWILSNPICIEQPLTIERTKKNLSEYRCDKPGVIVLDIDEIKSYNDMSDVIKFFKKSDYNLLLGKSKNWNGKSNFNLKGFLEVNFTNNWKNCKSLMSIIHEQLSGKGKIDPTASSDVSVQAPLFRNEVLIHKLDSDIKIDDDWITMNSSLIETKKENEFIQLVDTTKLITLCYQIYMKQGFSIISNRGDTINWSHPNEIKSKGGYFTYIDSPHIMHHPVKEKTINIFNEIKQTEEGKEFIKEQSVYQLKKQFEEHKKTYKHELIVDKQLLTIDDKMNKFIKRFMNNGDILKVKSAMGTGKSIVIDHIIKESQDLDKKVLIISNRISVANDYSNKYNIKTYQLKGDDKWERGENLIVQLDSLYHYDVRDFDIVILDEFVSLMFQSINSMQDHMRPFNSAKFHYILKNMKIVMADAFLSGYEDTFYEDKKIYYIQNNYRDNIDISYYEFRDRMFSELLNQLKIKKDDETITASIMSKDVINAIYELATDDGYKVFKLTSNTSDDMKKRAYHLFNSDENEHWDLLLYSPTLTVGVSNMNNCTHHFHYDAGNAADVISSLQMIKRTRKMKHLHLYLRERAKLEPTDEDTLNDLFNQNIERYFNGKTVSTSLIQVDEFANFTLSPIGMFMNKIQAFQNRLENHHKLSFNVLLSEQFRFNNSEIIKERGRLNFTDKIKSTKEKYKKQLLDNLKSHELNYKDEIEELLVSGRTLTQDDKIKIILYDIENKVNISDESIVRDICIADVNSEYKLIDKIQNMVILYKKDYLFVSNHIDSLITSTTNTVEFKEEISFYKDISKLFKYRLETWYSEKEIKKIQEEYKLNNLKKLLKRIGYKKVQSRYILDEDVKKYLKYFI